VLLERLDQRLPLLASGSRSAPERQRTLRATIAWSHDLLTPAEQELFARLAAFAGGCTLEAAEAICGADVDSIASLVDKSLLRRTGDRYWMLETIREYAAGQLAALPDEDSARTAHADWYLALGGRAGPELHTRQAREWLDRLEAEHANLRAALEHFVERGESEAALRLAASIWHYWATRGHWTEGRRLLAAVLAMDGDKEPRHLVEALWGAAIFGVWQGELDEGEVCALRILELAQQVGLPRGEAIGIHLLAIVAHDRGELDKARPLYEQSLELARTVDDAWLLSVATNNLGTLDSAEGDLARAADLFEESLAIGETEGDLERRARQLSNLGSIRSQLGDNDGARELYRRGLAAAVEIGVVSIHRGALSGIAACEAKAGNVVTAARLVGRTDALTSSLGLVEDDHGERQQTLAAVSATLGPDRLAIELAAGAALSPEEALNLALGQSGSATPA
jgi:tetratricopeptide (TPR) repeat protein